MFNQDKQLERVKPIFYLERIFFSSIFALSVFFNSENVEAARKKSNKRASSTSKTSNKRATAKRKSSNSRAASRRRVVSSKAKTTTQTTKDQTTNTKVSDSEDNEYKNFNEQTYKDFRSMLPYFLDCLEKNISENESKIVRNNNEKIYTADDEDKKSAKKIVRRAHSDDEEPAEYFAKYFCQSSILSNFYEKRAATTSSIILPLLNNNKNSSENTNNTTPQKVETTVVQPVVSKTVIVSKKKTCSPGSYLKDGRTCTPCPRGTYMDVENTATSCKACDKSSYSAPGTTGLTYCPKCPSGYMCYDLVSQVCPEGYYSNGNSNGACKKCASPTYSNAGRWSADYDDLFQFYCKGTGNTSSTSNPYYKERGSATNAYSWRECLDDGCNRSRMHNDKYNNVDYFNKIKDTIYPSNSTIDAK